MTKYLSDREKLVLTKLYYEMSHVHWSESEKIRCIRKKYQELYQKEPPSETSLGRFYAAIENNSESLNKTIKTQPKTKRTEDTVTQAKELFKENRKTSQRTAASLLNVSIGTINSIMRKDLNLYPYKMVKKPKINPNQYPLRLAAAQQMLAKHNSDPTWIDRVWFSDETMIEINPNFNSQNNRTYFQKGGSVLAERKWAGL